MSSGYPNYPPQQQPPPPYGMHAPGAPMPVPVTQVIIPRQLGPTATSTVCPSCQKNVVTRVEHEASGKTHLFALLLCILFCPCAILPYCMDSCQSANHYCPSCGAFLGAHDN